MVEFRLLEKAEIPAVVDGVLALYAEAGWLDGETPAQLECALENSHKICCAFDDKKLVGFFRAISDGVGDAYLLDLFVSVKYRKLGIGRKLAQTLVASLRAEGISWITAISTPLARNLYASICGAEVMEGHTPFRF